MIGGGLEGNYLRKSYGPRVKQSEDIQFLVGESYLFAQKNRTCFRKCGMFKDLSPLRVNFTSIKERLEEIFFQATGQKVSSAKLTWVHSGRISSKEIERELIVHSIKPAGNESRFDFYLGTHDSGYLIGGSFGKEEMTYEIIDQIDDRIRNIEVADVTGDEKNEVLVATHYDGMTAIYYPRENWERKIIDRNEYGSNDTFNHEVEVADLDEDGQNEIVSTPSQPNTFEKKQGGVIKLFDRVKGSWKEYKTEELNKSHIRKIEVYPEDNAIFAGVSERDKPVPRSASIIKYQFLNSSLRKVNETYFAEAERNFYPFLVRIKDKDFLIALSSNGLACAVDAENMKKEFVDRFSFTFEAFYTADVLDYNEDGNQDIVIVHDGKLSIYSVSEPGIREIESFKVYKNFDSTIVWAITSLKV